jgi:uncharacterized membrane protein YfcA
MSPHVIYLVVITLIAAVVNGGLGYGFSSITVPLALLFLSNRVLNPALVLIEVAPFHRCGGAWHQLSSAYCLVWLSEH